MSLNPAEVPALGYALAIALGPNEYLVAGQDVQVTFTPKGAGAEIAGLARVEAGAFVDGRWTAKPLLSRGNPAAASASAPTARRCRG